MNQGVLLRKLSPRHVLREEPRRANRPHRDTDTAAAEMNKEASNLAMIKPRVTPSYNRNYVEHGNPVGLARSPLQDPGFGLLQTDNVTFVTELRMLNRIMSRLKNADLDGRGSPPTLDAEFGEAGPLARARALAGLGIQLWRKKSIDIELLLSNSDRPKGP